MKKRMLSLALALVLALGLLPTAALATNTTQAIPFQYDAVTDFKCGLTVVANGKVGVYEDVHYFDGEYAIIDKTGKEVVPFGKYQSPYNPSGNCETVCSYLPTFSEGYAAVYLRDKGWGFIDTAGKEVIPCQYKEVGPFSGGLAAVLMEYGKGWGYIDKTGRLVIPYQYNEVEPFSDGLAAVRVEFDGEWGYIDKTGKLVIPCQYRYYSSREYSMSFVNGLAVVEGNTGRVENGRTVYGYGVIDTAGNTVVPFGQYKSISSYHDGLAEVRKDSGYRLTYYGSSVDSHGFIDTAGREVIPCQYENVRPFSEGLAAVETNSRWGFVDQAGNQVIPAKYDAYFGNKPALVFSEGLAAVYNSKSGWGYIDLHGNEVIPCQHGEARQLSEGMLAVDLDGKWGFVRVEGLPTEPKAVQTVTDDITPDKAADNTAYAATQTVVVDGQNVTFNAYALKDANGYATNYIKLRDVADVLNGSLAQFQVGWDGQITITTQAAYTPNGTEMVKNFEGDQTYSVNQSTVTVNGKQVNLEAITLTDATGGYTYFKLRDLGQALGFNVGWSAEKGIFLETDKPYDVNN